MKSLIHILFAFAFLAMSSCDNDDTASGSSDPLIGQWNLLTISGGFAGVDVDYEDHLVLWQFDTGTSMLRVETALLLNGPQNTFLPVPSGDHGYSVLEANGHRYLTIDGMAIYNNGEYGRIDINEAGDLIIDQGQSSTGDAADVYVLSFKR